MLRFLAAVALASIALPNAARAASVTISYEITGGMATVDLNPKPIRGGQFQVTLPATGTSASYSILSGIGTLQSFSLSAAGPSLVLEFAYTRVTARLTNKPSISGRPNGVFFGLGTLLFTGTQGVHCIAPGALCTRYGYFPPKSVTVTLPLELSAPYNYPGSFVAFSPVLGSGSLRGNYNIIGGPSGPAFITFTGQEVERVFMPEPGRGWLAVTALASLSGVVLLRTRCRGGVGPS